MESTTCIVISFEEERFCSNTKMVIHNYIRKHYYNLLQLTKTDSSQVMFILNVEALC